MCPLLDQKIFQRTTRFWRAVQVHVPRARARYRCRTLLVKEKMIGCHPNAGVFRREAELYSILIVGRTLATLWRPLGHDVKDPVKFAFLYWVSIEKR